MVEIKDVYQDYDGETLEENIVKYYHDDLQNMLLALVKGLCFIYSGGVLVSSVITGSLLPHFCNPI